MGKLLIVGLIGILIGVFVACGGNGDTGNGAGQTAPVATTAPATQASTAPAAQATAVSAALATATPPAPATASATTQGDEPEFSIQYTAITRTHPTFDSMIKFVEKVEERTNGRVQINMNSYPELGIAGPDTLGLLKNGTLSFAMIYSGYVAGEFPLIEMGELWGLYSDAETQGRVIRAVRDDEVRRMREEFNSQVILYQFFENQFIFSKTPVHDVDDLEGLKVRSHSASLSDLLDGLDMDAQFVAFSEVYVALERGILDAGVTAGSAGYGQRWYEVTDYLVGPIEARGHVILAMNLDQWDKLPEDIQQILLEEGQKTEEETCNGTEDWARDSIAANVAHGMEYIDFSPEIREAIGQIALERVLPNWVKRVGGPETEVAKIFNQKVGPIVGVKINSDGTASVTDPAQ